MSLQESPAALRRRLMNPPNAVRDDGIDLRRHLRPVPGPVAVVIPNGPSENREAVERQRQFDRACLKFFVWQCSPTVAEQREHRRRMRKIPPQITMAFITRVVADHFGVTVEGIRCESRQHRFAYPRQIAYWLCRNYTRHSFPEIGRYFNKSDHSSVIHGVSRIEQRRHADLQLCKTINELAPQIVVPVKKADNEEIASSAPTQISFVDTSVASVLRSTTLENRDADDQPAVPA